MSDTAQLPPIPGATSFVRWVAYYRGPDGMRIVCWRDPHQPHADPWDVIWQQPRPPAPIPDPVADLRFIPANPTTADRLVVDGSISTPAEHIERYSFQRLMPDGANSYDQPWDMGPMPAGPVVVELSVRLHDGRTARRQRAVTVTAA